LYIVLFLKETCQLKSRITGINGAGRGVAAVLIAGCSWGSTGVFVRILDGLGYSPLTIVFARMSLAFVIMLIALCVLGRRELLRVRFKDIWCFIGTGVSSAILLNLFFSMAIVMNSLSLAAILLATAPVFVVLLSAPIFGERVSSVKIQALVIAFAGCALTSGAIGSGSVFSPLGVFIGLLAGFGYALYSIMTRFALNRGYDPLTVNIYSFGIGSLVCAPFTNFSLIASTISGSPVSMAILLILHTLFASLLPYMLYTYGMKFMDTGKASILVSVEPVAATFFGVFLFSEIPTAVNVVGIALVLFAVALLNVPGGLRRLFRRRQ